jgi:hypothetical protein
LGYANKLSIDELFSIPAIGNAALTILTQDGDRWSVAAEAMPGADAG